MSEFIKASINAIPKFSVSTLSRSSVLGEIIHELSRAIASQAETMQKISASGLDTLSATRLIALDSALQTEKLEQLASETQKRLTPSTVTTIQNLKAKVTTGQQLTQNLTQARIKSALSEMTSAIQTAHQTLAQKEQRVVTDDLCSILTARGYKVQLKEASAGQTKWIRAKKGEYVVAAQVPNTGTLELDMAGFESGKCTEERKAIVQKLSQLGYQIGINRRTVHNRREGGPIVKEIERRFQEFDDQLRRLKLAKAQRTHRLKNRR